MKKKNLSLLLAATMVVGLLVGCGQGEVSESTSQSESVSQSSKSEESSTATEDGDEAVAYEPVTLKMIAQAGGNDDSQERWAEHPAGKKLYDDLQELGITLDIEFVPADSLKETVQTRMAAGVEIPDIISYGWNSKSDIEEWGKNGLVVPINELLDKYDTDNSVRTYYDTWGDGVWEMSQSEDGNNYYYCYFGNIAKNYDINTREDFYDVGYYGWEIRKDWVEAVGEEVKEVYTPEEFFDLLKKMRDEDANGNGEQDEIVGLVLNFDNALAGQFGLNAGLLASYKSDGKGVTANVYSENFPAYIQYLKDFYECGLYDTVCLDTPIEELVGQNRIAAYYNSYNPGRHDKFVPGYDETDLEKNYYVPVIIDTDGNLSNGIVYYTDVAGATVQSPYFVPTGTENEEAIVRLLKYIYTEEFAMLGSYGLEGEEYGWYYDKEGKIVITDVTDKNGEALNSVRLVMHAFPALPCPPVGKDYAVADSLTVPRNAWGNEMRYKLKAELYEPSVENGTVIYRTPGYGAATSKETEFLTEKENVLTTYMSELMTDLVLGRKSLDDLATYQKELQELGLDEYVKIMQDRYDRLYNE